MQISLATAVVALAAFVGTVVGETHTVRFVNNCHYGTPTLVQGGRNLPILGNQYTAHAPFMNATVFLQTGECGHYGEDCTVIQTTLQNVIPGVLNGSATSINIDLPYKFNVPASFSYSSGCRGVGANCSSQFCPKTERAPVTCTAQDVNRDITFCG